MEKVWSDDAWDDYLYWQTTDKKMLKKINLKENQFLDKGYRKEWNPGARQS